MPWSCSSGSPELGIQGECHTKPSCTLEGAQSSRFFPGSSRHTRSLFQHYNCAVPRKSEAVPGMSSPFEAFLRVQQTAGLRGTGAGAMKWGEGKGDLLLYKGNPDRLEQQYPFLRNLKAHAREARNLKLMHNIKKHRLILVS